MLEFKVYSDKINNVYNLLIIKNRGNNSTIKTLIDTGASLPVWVGGLDSFLTYFPNSVPQNMETVIKGFGKGFEVAPIYKIAIFELSDGTNTIRYYDLPVAIINRDYSFNMILSFPMFNRMNFNYVNYTKYKGKTTILQPPLFRLHHNKTKYYVGKVVKSVRNKVNPDNFKYFSKENILESIYIFTQ